MADLLGDVRDGGTHGITSQVEEWRERVRRYVVKPALRNVGVLKQ
jgi:hypothetical protein